MRGCPEEFPLLKAHNLYAAAIQGDGNCLFNALSDQLYGHQNEHGQIRARVIEYMREHAAYYKQFVDVYPGGGQRRNPKRKNAGAFSSPDLTPPTAAEIDAAFESHLGVMARGGTYGDNMEIVAFASAFKVDVKIHQHDFAYMIQAPDTADTGTEKSVAHIAYHTWEHYSSIRNIDGPHTGPPAVEESEASPQELAKNKAGAEKVAHILPWMINNVMQSLPYLADRTTIQNTLKECKGDVNRAVSILLDAEETASVSSQQGSSSTERDRDSDEEEFTGATKKQDRKLGRATKALKKKAEKVASDVEAGSKSNLASVRKAEPILVTTTTKTLSLTRSPRNIASKAAKTSDEGQLTPPDSDAELRSVSEQPGSENAPAKVPAKVALKKPSIKITFNNPDGPAKTAQKNSDAPRPKRVSAATVKQQKKLAQKAAKKERDQKSQKLKPASSSSKANISPPLDLGSGIKTLYI